MNTNIVLEPEIKTPFFVLLHQLGWDENELLYLKNKDCYVYYQL